ncbi:hypothetical protein ElP_33420 [Tautonia plasticadhaerens]|uniref:Uncharacterized protein n=2 Tax=Tautonia plasticadhaerens TaxID=2527974 RepID=A0A518H3M3_9BACT|nr:hypothetical protein ElP_33420 [Tautonia plasticadhaerens]
MGPRPREPLMADEQEKTPESSGASPTPRGQEPPPAPSKQTPTPDREYPESVAASATPPGWRLTGKVVRGNGTNPVLLTDGSFSGVSDRDVTCCNDGNNFPATVLAANAAVLVLRIDGQADGDCTIDSGKGRDHESTGGLTIQVKAQVKTFEGAVVGP